MYTHAYVIELDQGLVREAFRKRKKRKIGSIELYLSVMPQDVPRVRIKGVVEEKKILVEFEPINRSWGIVLMYRDEQSGLEVYQDFASGCIKTVKFPVDKTREFQSKISEVGQAVEKELANMEWEGRKVSQLDMKERQLSFLTEPEVICQIEVLKAFIQKARNAHDSDFGKECF